MHNAWNGQQISKSNQIKLASILHIEVLLLTVLKTHLLKFLNRL